MHINWSALGLVLVVAVVAAVALVTLFSAGVLMTSRRSEAVAAGRSGAGATTLAGVAFALCAAIVVFGVYLIVA